MNVVWSDLSAPEQWLSLLGSALILIAYALMVSRPHLGRIYYTMSLVGGICLLVTAGIYRNAGLMILELAWIGINLWGLRRT
ncbi:MAG: hypothetical protein D6703_03365 [Zetaproteobacteria bacterium]|nr:MAG: hypothetical protein D6703_03365 [Zetaproteobacteria bacterium]